MATTSSAIRRPPSALLWVWPRRGRQVRQCDVARGLNIRRLLERRTLDIDVARLRRAADLDLAVGTVVDVPIARTRADIDRLRLRRLFERELLADVDPNAIKASVCDALGKFLCLVSSDEELTITTTC